MLKKEMEGKVICRKRILGLSVVNGMPTVKSKLSLNSWEYAIGMKVKFVLETIFSGLWELKIKAPLS